MSKQVSNNVLASNGSPSKSYAVHAAGSPKEIVSPMTSPSKPYGQRGALSLEHYVKEKPSSKRTGKVNPRGSGLSPATSSTSTNKTAIVDIVPAQDKEEFPSLPVKKPAPSFSSAQSGNSNFLNTNCPPPKITCPLDHIFGKKQLVTKTPVNENNAVEHDEKIEVVTVANVVTPSSSPTDEGLISKTDDSAGGLRVADHFPSLLSVKHALPSQSAQTTTGKALPIPAMPQKLTFPLEHIFRKEKLTIKHPSDGQASIEKGAGGEKSSEVVFPSTSVAKCNLSTPSSRTTAAAPKGLSVTPPTSSSTNQGTSKKNRRSTSAIEHATSFIHVPATILALHGSNNTDLKTLPVAVLADSTNTNDGISAIATIGINESLSTNKVSVKKSSVAEPLIDIKHISPHFQAPASPDTPRKRNLSRKEMEKEQKALRKATLSAQRKIKLEDEKRDREQRKLEVKRAAETAAAEAIVNQSVQAGEAQLTPQEALLDDQLTQQTTQEAVSMAEVPFQSQDLDASAENSQSQYYTGIIYSPSQVKAHAKELNERLMSITESSNPFEESEPTCTSQDVLDNPIIAKEGKDPMAFVWSGHDENMDPDHPRPAILGSLTISQSGSDPMAWVWNRKSEDFEDDYPRLVEATLVETQPDIEEQALSLIDTFPVLIIENESCCSEAEAISLEGSFNVSVNVEAGNTAPLAMIEHDGLFNKDGPLGIPPLSQLTSGGPLVKADADPTMPKEEAAESKLDKSFATETRSTHSISRRVTPVSGSCKYPATNNVNSSAIPEDIDIPATSSAFGNSITMDTAIPMDARTITSLDDGIDLTKVTATSTLEKDTHDKDSLEFIVCKRKGSLQSLDTSGSSKIYNHCNKKSARRNISDSSSDSMASKTESSEVSSAIPASPRSATMMASEKADPAAFSPASDMTTISTALLATLLSTIQSCQATTSDLRSELDEMKAGAFTREAKIIVLEAEVNTLKKQVNPVPVSTMVNHSFYEFRPSKVDEVIEKALDFMRTVAMSDDTSSPRAVLQADADIRNKLRSAGDLNDEEVRSFAEKATTLSILANAMVAHAMSLEAGI